jgi:hypothetical protein
MDATVASLLGTSIGALAGLLGGFAAGVQQRSAERERWRQSRRDAVADSEREALLEVTALLAEGTQAASWLAWAATVKTATEMRAEVAEYDQRMRGLLPKLVSAEATASGLSDETFDRIDPLVQRLMVLDSRLGNAYVLMGSDAEAGLQALRDCKEPAIELNSDLVRDIRSVLRAEVPPDSSRAT